MSKLSDAQAARARAQWLVDHCNEEVRRRTRAQREATAEAARAAEKLEQADRDLARAQRTAMEAP